MTDKPKLLDLFCGGGGASEGYRRAGFSVTGVDFCPQPKYKAGRFIQADALDYVAQYGWMYDAIHASPPCQPHSSITKTAGTSANHLDLIPQTRFWLETLGLPYVIENVPGAPLRNALMLCGTMFPGLYVQRHRFFESNIKLLAPCKCDHKLKVAKHGRPAKWFEEYAGVSGHFSDVAYAQIAMGIDWMGQKELAQAIPPAYTFLIGKQLMTCVLGRIQAA